MYAADQFVAHLVGDFILQSDWMVLTDGTFIDESNRHQVQRTMEPDPNFQAQLLTTVKPRGLALSKPHPSS